MALQHWLGRSRPIENPEPFTLYLVRPPVPNDAGNSIAQLSAVVQCHPPLDNRQSEVAHPDCNPSA
jgi:hypothetical protein